VETIYLIDENNHTGYAQILEAGTDGNANGRLDQNSEVDATYTLGSDVVTDAQATAMHLLYDIHGSTRMLLDGTGNVVLDGPTPQVFTYDAYGNLLDFVGTPLTSLLYSGELTDAMTGQQYLRARYYDPATGRFNRLDPYGDIAITCG
jgi:RHS repeat-associated protein